MHVVKPRGGVNACLHSFLTYSLHGGTDSASPQAKEFTVPVEKESGLSFLEKRKIFCPLLGFETRFFGRAVPSLVTTPVMVSRILSESTRTNYSLNLGIF